jgi:benzodiazapine receptor
MYNDRLRQMLTVLAIGVTIAVNALATLLPLNGQTTGAISDRYPVLVTPAGYVFGIWGLIYLGLVVYAVYQALPAQRENPVLRAIAPWFLLSCAANIGWIFLWHYNLILLTLPMMLALLGSLLLIFARLRRSDQTLAERWLVRAPFSIYAGWITVATIVNVAVVLYQSGIVIEGPAAALLAAGVLAVGGAIAVGIALSLGDWLYALVIVWAYIGIGEKQSGAPLVVWAAWTLAALVAVAAVVALARGGVPREGSPVIDLPPAQKRT